MHPFDETLIRAINKIISECEIFVEYDAAGKVFKLKIIEPEPGEMRHLSVKKRLFFYCCDFSLPYYITGEICFHNILEYNCREEYECPDEEKAWEELSGRHIDNISYDGHNKKVTIRAFVASRGDEFIYEFTLTDPKASLLKKKEYFKDHPVDLSPATLNFFIKKPELAVLQNKAGKKNIAEAVSLCLSKQNPEILKTQ